MRVFGVMFVVMGFLGVGASAFADSEPELSVSLKPAARRAPASVDPARPLKPKKNPGGYGMKADTKRTPQIHRISPRGGTPLLDIDISIKED